MIEFKRSFSFSINSDLRPRLEEISEKYNCRTHKAIFMLLLESFDASHESGSTETVARLNEEISALKTELRLLRGNKTISNAKSQSQAVAPPVKRGENDFVAKVPPMAVSRVKQLEEDMYEEYDYTSNWEILKHFMKDYRAKQEGKLLLVMVPPRLKKLIEEFSQEPIESGASASVSHYVSRQIMSHFEAKKKKETKPTPEQEEKPKKEEKGGWGLW